MLRIAEGTSEIQKLVIAGQLLIGSLPGIGPGFILSRSQRSPPSLPLAEALMLRSIAAIVAGFVFIVALSIGADTILRSVMPGLFDAAGRVDSVPALLFIMAYVGVFAVSGCYLAARLAPKRPMLHALILGALGLVFNIGGTIAMWNTAPAWYHIVAPVLVMPYAWMGGRLREIELARAGQEVLIYPVV